MAFDPEKITREHVLAAVSKIINQKIELRPSTRFDVIIDSIKYPPKEIMRHAHSISTGDLIWRLKGGKPTNDYLKKFGFEIVGKKSGEDAMELIIARYKDHIRTTQFEGEAYKWQLIKRMSGRPNLDASDFTTEIKSMEYKNLVYPMGIAVLIHIANDRPEELRKCFVALFDENKDLTMRVKQFSEETLKLYRQLEVKLNHHQDERSISTYLTFRNPDKYMLFKTSFYEPYCDLIKVSKRKPKEKYAHYLELLDEFVDDYVTNDDELIDLKNQYLPKDRFEDKDHRLLAQDIIYQMLDKQEREARRTQKKYWRTETSDDDGNYWGNMKANGYASVGWPKLGDLSSDDIQRKDIAEMLNAAGYYITDKINTTKKSGEIYNFLRVIKAGDVVVAQDGAKVLGIGIVKDEDVVYRPGIPFPHCRVVDWKVIEPVNFQSNDGLRTSVFEITDETTKRTVEQLFEDDSNNKMTAKADYSILSSSKNVIIYGPPGTGKTFYLKDNLFPVFSDTSAVQTKDEFGRSLIGDLAWWEVIAIVLLQSDRNMSLQELYIHPLLTTKAELSSGKTPKHTIRARIQQHCVDVSIKHKLEPQVFRKDENALWSVDQAILLKESPELNSKASAYRDFKPVQKTSHRYVFTTFHQSMGYEDFIEGIKPVVDEETGQVIYEVVDGIFLDIARKATKDPDNNYALFIDEINRGNVSSIFGELITLIEDDKRKGEINELSCVLTYSKKEFSVPSNLYIIGTMNTADRSVEALDTALRRRFSFKELTSQSSKLNTLKAINVDLPKMLDAINLRIEYLLDKDHRIGHAYFMGIAEASDQELELKKVFSRKILPLLNEFFYAQPHKTGLVLGEKFVQKMTIQKPNQIFHKSFKPDDIDERALYEIKDPMTFENMDPFRSIYEG
jgi:5-methylcytosine-specific restriction protein B